MYNGYTPKFCSPPRPTLPSAAFSRAAAERVFVCLPEELVDVVLRRYVEHVHPQLPILDISALFSALDQSRKTKRPSVLLWQALTTAVIPFFTESELGMAGHVSTETALNIFMCRSKVLIELNYETCQITELQAILLLCWRLSLNTSAWSVRYTLLDRALRHVKEIEPTVIGTRSSKLRNPTALKMRLWWSCYLLQAGPTVGTLHNTTKLGHPSAVQPLTLNDFDISWLSYPRALKWYRSIGRRQALTQYLQLASCFCRKVELCAQLEGVKHPLSERSVKEAIYPAPARHLTTTNEAPALSGLFWTAKDIDAELQKVAQEGIIESHLWTKRDEMSSAFLVHTADFFILYRVVVLSLFWSERLLMAAKVEQGRPKGEMLLAEELIRGEIERVSMALFQLVDSVCFYRLPLLAHNINPHILENVRSIATLLDSATGAHPDDCLYREHGRLIRNNIWRYENHIVLQSTLTPSKPNLVSNPEINIHHASGLSSDASTAASTPTGTGPLTPATDHDNSRINPKPYSDLSDGELLQIIDSICLF